MSKLEVNAIEPQTGTTITIGASGDTVNLVGTLQSNGSPLPGDISSVVAGTGLSGGGTTGAVTINIEAAQPTITSLGTITSFRSSGIDDNASALRFILTNDSAILPGSLTLDYGSANGNPRLNFDQDNISGSSFIEVDRNSLAMEFYNNGSERMRISSGGDVGIGTGSPGAKLSVDGSAIFNESSADVDFRVESNGNANMLFVDGGANRVGIGTGSPGATLETIGTAGNNFKYATSGTYFSILPEAANGNVSLRFRANAGNAPDLIFKNDAASEVVRIGNSGNVGIGNSNPSQKLDILGTNNTLQDIKTSTATGIGGIQLRGNDSSSYLKVFHLGSSFGGTTFGGVTGNNQSLIEAQGASSLAFTTQGGTPDIIFAPARTARMTIKNDGKVGIGTASPQAITEIVGGTGDIKVLRLRTGDSTAANNSGIDFNVLSSATQGNRSAVITLDADGANATGSDYFQFFKAGGSNQKIFFPSNDLIFEGSSEHIRITSAGKVGIGTSSPGNYYTDKLVINAGSTQDGMTIVSTTSGSGMISFADGTSGDDRYRGYINYNHSSNYMDFATNAAARMRIDSNGFVNIGSADVVGQFQVKGGGFIIAGETTAGTNSSIVYSSKRSSNGTHFRFTQSSTVCGDITTNGSAVTYGSNSDYRLKENVSYDFDATTRLKQLKPARFNFIVDETNTLIDGFIAHEVQSVVPEAITGTHNQVEVWKDNEELPEGVSIGDNKLDDDGNTIPEYQGIDQSKLVPLLVKTIQELEARITTLENA